MKLKNFKQTTVYVLGAVILSIGLLIIQRVNASPADETNSTLAIPIPPTPDINSLRGSEKPVPALPQRSVSRTINLADGLSDEDIFVYIVLRTNGIYEEYHISATYSGDKNKLMELKPGDKIVTGYPQKPLISTPVLEQPAKEKDIEETTPTGEPYPAPSNETYDNPIIQPYP